MIRGEYKLVLVCDQLTVNKQRCGTFDFFAEPTKMEAKAKAREAGWMFKRENKCLCPTHANLDREKHYRSAGR